MSRPFTVDRLRNLYEMRKEWPDQRTFWRHDVDYSVEAAFKMAELEYHMGVTATYYLIAGPFYGDGDAIELSMYLSGFGHRIGWHVDTRVTDTQKILDSVGGNVPVSFHCPREYELWKPYGFDCAYHAMWEGLYYSDSRGEFAHGDPEDSTRWQLQINLHPEWWFDPEWASRVDDVAYEDFFYEPKSRLPAR